MTADTGMGETGARYRFSIVVPSYNHAHFLPGTLDSIFDQTPEPHQVVVADGASNDGTVEVLERYAERYPQLEWLSEPDDGPADAVNKGLARVTGDVVGIQSSDDIYYPGAFAAVARALDMRPDCGFAYGDVEGIDEQGSRLYRRRMPEPSWEAFFGVSLAIPQSSVFFRSELIERAGYWNGRYYSCDIDYWMRLLFHTDAVHVPEVLSAWRSYPGQRTRPEHAHRIWDDYWRMIDESPDIAAASGRVRRLARASKHILALRFPPEPSRLVVWRHLLFAMALHPGFWRYNPTRKLLKWVPGFEPARRIARYVRNRLTGDRTPQANGPRQ